MGFVLRLHCYAFRHPKCRAWQFPSLMPGPHRVSIHFICVIEVYMVGDKWMNLPVLQAACFPQLLVEFHQLFHHVVVVAFFVRHHAVTAVFDAAF